MRSLFQLTNEDRAFLAARCKDERAAMEVFGFVGDRAQWAARAILAAVAARLSRPARRPRPAATAAPGEADTINDGFMEWLRGEDAKD